MLYHFIKQESQLLLRNTSFKASWRAEGMYRFLQAAADSWNRTCFIFPAVGRKHTGASSEKQQFLLTHSNLWSVRKADLLPSPVLWQRFQWWKRSLEKLLSETLIYLEFRPLWYGCDWLTNLARRQKPSPVSSAANVGLSETKLTAGGSFLQEAAFKTPWGWRIIWSTK